MPGAALLSRLISKLSWIDAKWRFGFVVIVTIVMTVLIQLHVKRVNGPSYWKWSWRRLDYLPLYPAMLLSAVPFGLAQLHFLRLKQITTRSVVFLMMGTWFLQLVASGLQQTPFSLERVWKIVEHPLVTSYYTDAVGFLNRPNLLADYPNLLSQLHIHSQTKPPGQILYFMFFIRLLGVNQAASFTGGILITLLATLAIPGVLILSRALGLGQKSAFTAASLMALCPSLILFSPAFDQVYPAVICLLIAFWIFSFKKNPILFSIGLGLILSLILLFSPVLLISGAIIAALGLTWILEGGDRRHQLLTLVGNAAIAFGVVLFFYLFLWILTRYNPIELFRNESIVQAAIQPRLNRPYSQTVKYDPLDIALGTGWIVVALAIFSLIHFHSTNDQPSGVSFYIRAFCIGQVALLPLSGILRAENARVAMFLMPFLMVPAGIELSKWPAKYQAITYFCLWFLMVNICQNMLFF